MRILVVNAGSTSLKFKLYESADFAVLATCRIERIGSDRAVFACEIPASGAALREENVLIADYTSGVSRFLAALTGPGGALASLGQIGAVAFKTVLSRGFSGTHALTEDVKAGMRAMMTVAPAHNGPYLEVIGVFENLLPGVPLIGAFETEFHQTIPAYRRVYPIPADWTRDYGIYKMGYHGASHGYVALVTGEKGRVISCHLGGSGSLCAILDGKSVDNSFGLSLQAGIPHNNRSGDIDPFIIPYLLDMGLSPDQIERGLTQSAGLKGVSGTSGDMRDVEAAMDAGDPQARLAFELYCDSVRRTIGAYAAELSGLDTLVFTGGIGEKSARVRACVCRGLTFLGVYLDDRANEALRGEGVISTPESPALVRVVAADEECMVARRALSLMNKQ